MSETKSFVIQAAELLTTKPFEIITAYYKNKQDQKKNLIQLITDACFETQVEINNLKAGQSIVIERQREISRYWSKVCAELLIAYPSLSGQFHAKAMSWASVNTWNEKEIDYAQNNLKVMNDFVNQFAANE